MRTLVLLIRNALLTKISSMVLASLIASILDPVAEKKRAMKKGNDVSIQEISPHVKMDDFRKV